MTDTAFLNVSASITGRRWTTRGAEVERTGLAIAQRWNLPEIVGRVMAGRGVDIEAAGHYLTPRLRDLLPDPATLIDMEAAAARLAQAVNKVERIAVFGDYDVDGAASSALLIRWLRALGRKATLYIPDRIDEGYGLSDAAMERLARAHDLIVAVDCGTLSFGPVATACAAGAEVIIADHHLAAETAPDCAAVVNPNRQDDDSGQGHLCAAGVVFLLLIAANRRLRADGWFKRVGAAEPDLKEFLDLVALATVADVAPLIGVNRALVRQGLRVMAQRRSPGLRALTDTARLTSPPTAYHLGFALGPRINAGGRVGEATLGARLLATDDAAEAEAIAERLEDYNLERRAIEAAVLAAAAAQVEARGAEGPLVWAANAGWHPGVVGIVASRLKEKYNRPALVIGFDAEGVGKGSGRSIPGVDLGRAIATCAREGLFAKGGGHQMAAGVTVDQARLPAAIARLSELLDRQGAGADGPRDLKIDGALRPRGATVELCETLEAAGPYGASAPAPRFALPAVRIAFAKPVGESHLRLSFADDHGGRLDAIAFRAFETDLGPFLANAQGRPVHVVGRLEIDDWGGRRKAKLRVEDAAPMNDGVE